MFAEHMENGPMIHRSRKPWALLLLAAAVGQGQPAPGQTTAVVAVEIGITPESLVIAGIDTVIASTVLTRIQDAQDLRASLAFQRQLAHEAVNVISALSQASFDESPEDAAQLEAAVQQLEAAQGAIQQLCQGLFDAALEGAPPATLEKLAAWRGSTAYRLAPEFRVSQRTADQWKALEHALRAERRAQRRGEDLAPDLALLLAEVRAEPAVVEATNSLAANLEPMRQLFSQFGG